MPRTSLRFAATLIGSLAFACSDDSEGGAGTSVSFATSIHPILSENCGICHGAGTGEGASYPAHGSDNVQEAFTQATMDGLEGQKVYERILFRTDPPASVDIMPIGCGTGLDNGTCLTSAEHDLIEQWVAAGTPP